MLDSGKNIMLRVMKKRMLEGETLDEIFMHYPKLTEQGRQELEQELEKG